MRLFGPLQCPARRAVGQEYLGDLSKNRMKLTVYPCRIQDGYLWIALE